MNDNDKQSSLLKKERLFNKIAVDKQSSFLVTWWLAIAQLLKDGNCVWELEYLDVIADSQYEFWIEKLNQDPWSSFSFSRSVIQIGDKYWVHEMLYLKYPSMLPLRYLPDLEKFCSKSNDYIGVFKEIIARLLLNNQAVFLFYIRMNPVIKINLYDLLILNLEAILPEEEDVAIMAIDGSWLIFKSMEGEWVFGRL
ncbi:hypothetical protein [Sediminibacterium sp.]|uniref:hypothetical protein n=1 Tax=Sediminibacterium sp. TaxID=1917865 RepID=UPI0027325B6A|nr:hypothetical protein [Sediminibacterium sp.]MDP3394732.1 hypothetical protein [Sediminibacterium sp.]MDP3568567.1 hypothetical protein [Sediminibacterium sp.]